MTLCGRCGQADCYADDPCEHCGKKRSECSPTDWPEHWQGAYEREKARADTLRLDVAWWRARVEAVELERDEARAFWRSRAEEAWTERDGWKARAEAAEAKLASWKATAEEVK